MKTKSDSELIALTRSGHKKAFGQLIERHRQTARRVALDMVASEETAQELVQEALLQAYLSLDRLSEAGRFKGWLCGIVRNVCLSHLRARRKEVIPGETPVDGWPFDAAPVPVSRDPQVIAEERERQRLVLNAVHALSPENRDATLLFYYEQRSLREIAAALGISVVAVKGRLHKSRKQLRALLLPLYPAGTAPLPPRQRRKKMVKVFVRAAFDQGVFSVGERERPAPQDPALPETDAQQFLMATILSLSPACVRDYVGLLEESGRRFLPIRVGKGEVEAVKTGQTRFATDKSMTFDLMVNLLKATDARLEEVRIESLQGEIFYATIKVRHGAGVREVDARPGDAIPLAVQTNSPVYVAEEIMESAGWDLSDAPSVVERLRHTGDEASLRKAAADPWVVKVADGILENALPAIQDDKGNRVTEVSFEPRPGAISLVARTNTDLTGRTVPLPRQMLALLTARFKLLANLNVAEQGAPQEGHASVRHKGRNYDLLVVTGPTRHGEKLILRLHSPEFDAATDPLRPIEELWYGSRYTKPEQSLDSAR